MEIEVDDDQIRKWAQAFAPKDGSEADKQKAIKTAETNLRLAGTTVKVSRKIAKTKKTAST